MVSTGKNEFVSEITEPAEIAAMAVLGDRECQEDCFGFIADESSILFCLCDGMGGQKGGDIASRSAVNEMVAGFSDLNAADSIQTVLSGLTTKADRTVFSLKDEKGNRLNAGTTLVAAVIRNHELYWNSAGDSRLYIFRRGKLRQITKDQNYRTVLEEQLMAGEICESEFQERNEKGEELINYIGVGNLSFIDYSATALKLKQDDILMICSDGLYKVLNDAEISMILQSSDEPKKIMETLEKEARLSSASNCIKRDNMTVILAKVR